MRQACFSAQPESRFCTAAALRAKSCVMKTAATIQENAEDIYAEAQQINEERAAAEAAVEDEKATAEAAG